MLRKAKQTNENKKSSGQVTDDIPINGRPLIRRCRRIFFGIERWSL